RLRVRHARPRRARGRRLGGLAAPRRPLALARGGDRAPPAGPAGRANRAATRQPVSVRVRGGLRRDPGGPPGAARPGGRARAGAGPRRAAPQCADRIRHRVRSVMKTSLGIWALGPMITRFVPVGYQPEHDYGHEPTAEKVARAVAGLGDLMGGYEFHYPAELS